eukprot:9472849-Pyramimonas_sp.AAC.1
MIVPSVCSALNLGAPRRPARSPWTVHALRGLLYSENLSETINANLVGRSRPSSAATSLNTKRTSNGVGNAWVVRRHLSVCNASYLIIAKLPNGIFPSAWLSQTEGSMCSSVCAWPPEADTLGGVVAVRDTPAGAGHTSIVPLELTRKSSTTTTTIVRTR